MVNGLLGQVLGWDDLLNDLLLDLLSQLLGGDVLGVLGRNNNSVNPDWDNSSIVVPVLNSDLSLGVWSQPWEGAISAGSSHLSIELVCQLQSQWEEFRGLVGGISEHDTLVTSTKLLKSLLVVETLSDIGGLFLDGDENVASLVVEPFGRIIVTDVLDSISDNFLVVEMCLCGDLSEDHDHTGLCGSLTRNL